MKEQVENKQIDILIDHDSLQGGSVRNKSYYYQQLIVKITNSGLLQ